MLTRQRLAIITARKLNSDDVLHCDAPLAWLDRSANPLFEPGGPWENGYIESIN